LAHVAALVVIRCQLGLLCSVFDSPLAEQI
jgi:hypothetical protein